MMRVVECRTCGECERFDSWPDDSDEALDQLIRSEMWTFDGSDEYCPDHNPDGDRDE